MAAYGSRVTFKRHGQGGMKQRPIDELKMERIQIGGGPEVE
jgi:hypothetical protein